MKLKLTVIGIALFVYGNYLSLAHGWKIAGLALITVGAVLFAARFSFDR